MDEFATHASGLTSPVEAAAPVVPDDAADLPFVSRMIYVGGSGSITVEMVDAAPGETVTMANVQAGAIYPIRVRKVLATGTTATGLVAFW